MTNVGLDGGGGNEGGGVDGGGGGGNEGGGVDGGDGGEGAQWFSLRMIVVVPGMLTKRPLPWRIT